MIGRPAETPVTSRPRYRRALRARRRPADGETVITVISPFEVPAEREAEFTAAWKAMSEVAARLPGYRAARLHRSRGNAHFRYVGISMWDSEQSISGALAGMAGATKKE